MQLIAVTQSFQSQDYKHTSLKSNPTSIQPRLGDLKNSKTPRHQYKCCRSVKRDEN